MLVLVIAIILLIGLFIAGSSYGNLISQYNKYSKVESGLNCNAYSFICACVEYYGLKTRVMVTKGELNDAYLIKKDIIVLSENVANGTSVADISIACHELGHAMQKNEKSGLYALDRVFSFLSKIANFFLPLCLIASFVFIFIGELSYLSPILFYVGAGLWIIIFVFKVLLIPLELDASKRAYNVLSENKIFNKKELKGTKKVLNAAAWTYVGAIFAGLYKLLYRIRRSFSRD